MRFSQKRVEEIVQLVYQEVGKDAKECGLCRDYKYDFYIGFVSGFVIGITILYFSFIF